MLKKEFFNRASYVGVGFGAALVLEHLITYGGFDPVFGHEHVGLIIFIISFVVNTLSREVNE